jgi:hypothetical protein
VGLNIGRDPVLAWMLIKVLLNDGKPPDARHALEGTSRSGHR